VLFIGLNR